MAHSARLIVLCIVATLLITSVTAQVRRKKSYHSPWRSDDYWRRNTSNTTSQTVSLTLSNTRIPRRRRTFPTNTSSLSVSQTLTQSQSQSYSLTQTYSQTLSKSRTIKVNFTNATTLAPNTTNATIAPNTTANVTIAPNTTANVTRAPNTTAPNMTTPNATNATTAAPNTTATPNFTRVPPITNPPQIPLPPGQTTGAPAESPRVVGVFGGDIATFNNTLFRCTVAELVSLTCDNVNVFNVSSASVRVEFGFRGNLPNGEPLSPSAISAATSAFVQNANNSAAFTRLFPVESLVSVTFTPAPFRTNAPFDWRQISASSKFSVSTLLLGAAVLIASFFH